jgi:hypothetical protein
MSKLELHRLGGCMQPIFRTAADLEHIWALDEARWVAISAPVRGLRCDPVLLGLLDDDADGRIRPLEIKRGVRWLLDRFSDSSGIDAHSDSLQLAALRMDEVGLLLRAAAQRVLVFLDKEGEDFVTLAQVRQVGKQMTQALTAGDGVVTLGSSDDDQVERLIADIGQVWGLTQVSNGMKGIDEKQLDRFEAATSAYLDWIERPASVEGLSEPARAWRALDEIAEKLKEFFALSDLASLDPRIATLPGLSLEELESRDWADRSAAERRMQEAPIARPNPKGQLDPQEWINPAWCTRWQNFQRHTLEPLGLSGALDRQGLRGLESKFRKYATWQGAKAGDGVEKLGRETLEHWDVHPETGERLRAYFSAERSVATELQRLGELERLILHQRWMLELVNSFVGFSRFYDPNVRSLVEVGTLIMDGRRFNLCVQIEKVDEHRKIAKEGLIYLVYLRVEAEPKPFLVAAAVTGQERGRLFVGKRGVFYDPELNSYEAVVVELLENPISVTEALMRPFRKLGDFLAERSESFSQSRYVALEKGVGGALDEGPKGGVKEAGAAKDLFLSGGIALAAVSSAMAYVAETLSNIEVVDLTLTLLGLVLLAVVPAAIISGFRIHRRDLSIVLEASGWAINQRLRIPTWAGAVYTQRPPFPEDAVMEGHELLRTYRKGVEVDEREIRRKRLSVAVLLVLLSAVSYLVFDQLLGSGDTVVAALQRFWDTSR